MREFGGDVLPESASDKSADYLFREQNIVAELKCLTVDQTEDMNRKVTRVVEDWVRKHGTLPPGYNGEYIEISKAPSDIVAAWMKILCAPIEGVIKDANRQIRATKLRLNIPHSQGLLLTFNQGNLLHNRPHDFRLLVANIIRKRTPEKELRFPHIQGLVYFLFETVKNERNMSFWAPAQFPASAEVDVSPMRDFQLQLREGWYSFIRRRFGLKINQHSI